MHSPSSGRPSPAATPRPRREAYDLGTPGGAADPEVGGDLDRGHRRLAQEREEREVLERQAPVGPRRTAFENLWGAVPSEIGNRATSTDDRTTARDGGEKVVPPRVDQPSPEDHAGVAFGARPPAQAPLQRRSRGGADGGAHAGPGPPRL